MAIMATTTPADVLSSDKTAIVVVDFQNDFMEGGNLAVGGADYAADGKDQSYQKDVTDFIEQCRSRPNL